MRSIEARKAWADAVTRNRRFRLSRFRIAGKPPLANSEVDLPNGLVVVCGLNGVGKTTLLRLLARALGLEQNGLRSELIEDGEFEVAIDLDGTEHVSPFDAGVGVAVNSLDASEECGHLLALSREPNFEDLIEGFEPHEWSEAEVSDARYVVGKHYTDIRVTEFEDPGPAGNEDSESGQVDSTEDPTLPYIEVTVGGLTYDFRTMGLGELAALLLLWRIRRAEAQTVILLEEPETYLSARASTALVSLLARAVHEKRLYAVVTTHSPGLIRDAPVEAVRLLSASTAGVVFRPPASRAELEYRLGLPSGPARIVLVEDHTARDFTQHVMGRFAGFAAGRVEYLIADGEEPINALCRKLPSSEALAIVGVLDGDQPEPDGETARWPIVLLPGGTNPDALLRDAAIRHQADFANAISREIDEIAAACEMHAGVDEHDWLHDVARTLNVDVHTVRRAAADMWLREPANEADAIATVAEIVQALKAEPPSS